MKLAIILGTRPEIVKMSPIIRECENQNLDYFILHTGQHYSYELDKVFIEELDLPYPKYNIEIGSGTHAEETGKALIGIERILMNEKPDIVLVEGDTNTVLAGALTASKLHISPYRACGKPLQGFRGGGVEPHMGQSPIKVGHVEAGLRSGDRSMPEEINRILSDHCSDYLFAPTKKAKQNLLREGIADEKIFVTGNTIVDAVYQHLSISEERVNPLNDLELTPKEYFLVTAHRQENVDVKEKLRGILNGLELVHDEFSLPIIYPIHPRTSKKLKEFGLKVNGVDLINPLGYLEFLQLEAKAKLVLTDSGGIQEETCILGRPCVTLRDNTERPETLEVGSNILVGTDPEKMLNGVEIMLTRENNWKNPFGDGTAGLKITDILIKEAKK